MSSNDADALASWGGGQDLSAWEALMWRTGGDYRTRSTGVIVELLDTEPDWDRLVAAGVDAIITDDPAALLERLGRRRTP